ncbi:MAG: tetratricopeptide repeat protein [Acidobacteria bacterium]|nr:tetratricopeptide repeat protein [Acidobacteriota bacterium]MDW7984297.1 tetratricopeptide repeat protein [Acidobacteriota bacterium]
MPITSAQRVKLLQQADDLYQKGKYDKAIPLFEKLIEAEPRDIASRQRLIDCYEKLNQKEKALVALSDLADFYIQDGRIVHAVATLRRALKLEPTHVEVMHRLADLLIQQNNLVEAKNLLLTLAEQYGRLNRLTKVLEVLNRLVEIGPQDLRLLQRRAHVKAELGRHAEALEEYQSVAEAYLERGTPQEAIQAIEQGLRYVPANPTLTDLLIRAYMQAGAYSSAIGLIERLPERSYDHLLWLTQAYHAVGRTDKAVQTLMEALRLAPERPDAYGLLLEQATPEHWDDVQRWLHPFLARCMDKGQYETAWSLLERALQKSPADPVLLQDAIQLLNVHHQSTRILVLLDRAIEAHIRQGQWSDALRLVDQILAIDPDSYEYLEKRDYILKHMGGTPLSAEPVRRPESPPPAVEVSLSPALAPEVTSLEPPEDESDIQDYIQEQLTEADVFYRYGMIEKALQKLTAVLRQYPLARSAERVYQRCVQFLTSEERRPEALEVLLKYAEFLYYYKRFEDLQRVIDEVQAIQPDHPQIQTWLAKTTQAVAAEESEYLDISAEISELISADLQSYMTRDQDELQSTLSEVAFYIDQGLYAAAHELIVKSLRRWPHHLELEAWLQKVTERMTAAAAAPAEAAEGEDIEIQVELEEASLPESEVPVPAVALTQELPPAFPSELIDNLLQPLEVLATAEAPSSAEMPESLPRGEGPAELHPETPTPRSEEPPAPSASTPARPIPVYMDEELGLEFEDLSADWEGDLLKTEAVLDTVSEESWRVTLNQFRRKVEEVVPEEDASTHYHLGVAYMQMDLIEEAIAEFQKAARHRDYAAQSHIQLAECFARKGLPEAALRSLQRVLEMGSEAEEVLQEVKYMMAALYEQMGELDRAYDLYIEVYSIDARYRDVTERIQQLEVLRRQKPS